MKQEKERLRDALEGEEMYASRFGDHSYTDVVVPHSTDASANLAQVSNNDRVNVLTRLVIPSVLAVISTILSYKVTNIYFAEAAAGGAGRPQALAQIDSDMFDIDY